MSASEKINLNEKFDLFSERWSPKVVGQLNQYDIRIAKIIGEFVWHSHDDTDEFFLIVKGQMQMRLRDKTIDLKEGEIFVVPRGIEHQPFAEEECHILMLEPQGTLNTGAVTSDRTVHDLERI